MAFSPADERPHPAGPDEWWEEAWRFELWTPDGRGAFTWLTVLPNRRQAWYWAVLVGFGPGLVHLADLEVAPPRADLEIRAEGLWASHVCEAPFEQWTVANEAYGVALDDPVEALGAARGVPTPLALDLEWYATEGPVAMATGERGTGYDQAGVVDGVIELPGGPLAVEAPARRSHWWGTQPAGGSRGSAGGDPGDDRIVAALALDGAGGGVLHRRLGPDGWSDLSVP